MDAFHPPPSSFDSSFNSGGAGSEWRLVAARTAMNRAK